MAVAGVRREEAQGIFQIMGTPQCQDPQNGVLTLTIKIFKNGVLILRVEVFAGDNLNRPNKIHCINSIRHNIV